MLRLDRAEDRDVPGETNRIEHIARGVVVVIPPWNFPLAILTGMSSAALAVGNSVVLKPASQSPVIGAQLIRLLRAAGLPPGVANFLTGPGGEVGEALVSHPQVQVIAFTGSREVGVRIMQRASEIQPGQTHLKRVIAELGGKNAIIVLDDANLDLAIEAVTWSAFGTTGQRCTATSRLIVQRGIKPRLVEALVAFDRAGKGGSAKAAAVQKLRAVTEMFEAARAGATTTPEWGAAEAYAFLGRVLYDQRDLVGAREALERALLIAPDYALARRLAAQITR